MEGVYNTHLWSIKEQLRQKYNVKKLGSHDSGVKKFTSVGSSKWFYLNDQESIEAFLQKAADAMSWLHESCDGAWRYSAQDGWVDEVNQFGKQKLRVARHFVQFENEEQALLFKLAWR